MQPLAFLVRKKKKNHGKEETWELLYRRAKGRLPDVVLGVRFHFGGRGLLYLVPVDKSGTDMRFPPSFVIIDVDAAECSSAVPKERS